MLVWYSYSTNTLPGTCSLLQHLVTKERKGTVRAFILPTITQLLRDYLILIELVAELYSLGYLVKKETKNLYSSRFYQNGSNIPADRNNYR